MEFSIELSDAELEGINGGTTIVGMSVESQQRIAMQQRLTDAYLHNHPVELGPAYVLDR